jgi:hypothetical protein
MKVSKSSSGTWRASSPLLPSSPPPQNQHEGRWIKLRDLAGLLASPPLLTPLKLISFYRSIFLLQGILYYPIKGLGQCTYTDIIIVAKYEGKRKKDKVKVVEVK